MTLKHVDDLHERMLVRSKLSSFSFEGGKRTLEQKQTNKTSTIQPN